MGGTWVPPALTYSSAKIICSSFPLCIARAALGARCPPQSGETLLTPDFTWNSLEEFLSGVGKGRLGCAFSFPVVTGKGITRSSLGAGVGAKRPAYPKKCYPLPPPAQAPPEEPRIAE